MRPWVIFALSAALFWGAYVPTIFYGQQAFGPKNPNASIRAFLFIGLAYFIMAILVPGLWLLSHKLPVEVDGGFNAPGGWLSTAAGALGAAGALCVVFALKYARADNPGYVLYVAPIVFAGAPIINVLISWTIDAIKGHAQAPNPMFIVGLIVSVIGVATVLLNNPAAHKPAPSKPVAQATR